jgi:murein DD-endopeptidase MepM/ murein hydrolase activator NlpD
VIAVFDADMSKRGIEIVLRHSPEEAGLPFWTYSAYGHLDKKPEMKIGQRVKKGQVLGPTGNSG